MSVQRRHGVVSVLKATLWTLVALALSSFQNDCAHHHDCGVLVMAVHAFQTQTIRHRRSSSWSMLVVRTKTNSTARTRPHTLQGQLYLCKDAGGNMLDDERPVSHQVMPSSTSRRAWIHNQVVSRVTACAAIAAVTIAAATTATATASASAMTTSSLPTTALSLTSTGKASKNGSAATAAAAVVMTTSWTDIRQSLQDATDTLDKLVQNWQRAVVDCTYADVTRDLLEQRNKELLLEKASTFALFDKSVSIVSCKTVVNTVRDYLGRTGIGPVAKLEATLQLAVTKLLQSDDNDIDIDVEDVERILTLVDDIRTTLIRADSLSYAARRDYTALNNFAPDLATDIVTDATSNLFLCQSAIQEAFASLTRLLSLLPR